MSTQQEDLGASLLKAVEGGKKSDVEKLFEENAAAVEYVNHQDRNLHSPLLLASCLGYTEIVEFLLEKGAFVDMIGIDEMTALSAASESGHHEIIEKLVEDHGAQIDHISHRSFTPLMLASRHGHTESVKVLLKLKANVNMTTGYSSYTALMLASKDGHAEVVKLLLPHVTKVSANRNGLTPLMFASANGHDEVARMLLENNKSQVNQRCSNGYTSLLLASYFGHDKVAEVLIEYGANVDMRTRNGTTALIEACSHGHVQFVKVLLDHNAEVNLSLYSSFQIGTTALMIACQNNSLEIVKLLLRGKDGEPSKLADSEVKMSGEERVVQERSPQADVNLQDSNGRTALNHACEKGGLEIVQMLVNHGANVNPSSTGCVSPLLHAVRRENVDIVRVLLKKGANPNPPKDRDGGYNNTPPLIVATLIENVDIVQLLLSHKANVNVSTKLDSRTVATPLLLAISVGCHKLVEIFVQNGANVQKQFKRTSANPYGRQSANGSKNPTLVDLAKECGDTKIIRLLKSVPKAALAVGNDTSDDEEPQAQRMSEDNSVEKSCKDLLSSIERNFQSLDSHSSLRSRYSISDLFPSDHDFYTSLLERLGRSTSQNSTRPVGNSVPVKQPPTPTEGDAYEILLPVASNWMNIGVLLKIKYSKLETIEADKKAALNALLAMVVEWVKMVNPPPSWNQLVKAVKPFNEAVAQSIEQKFCI